MNPCHPKLFSVNSLFSQKAIKKRVLLAKPHKTQQTERHNTGLTENNPHGCDSQGSQQSLFVHTPQFYIVVACRNDHLNGVDKSSMSILEGPDKILGEEQVIHVQSLVGSS